MAKVINPSYLSCLNPYSAQNDLAKLHLHPSEGRPGPSNGTGVLYLRLERSDKTSGVNASADNAGMPATQVGIKASPTGNKIHSASLLFDLY